MKRTISIIALVMILVLALCLSACGKKDDNGKKTETPMDILVDVLNKTAESRAGEDSTLFTNALQNGSYEMVVSMPDLLPLKNISLKQYNGATSVTTIAIEDLTNQKLTAAVFLGNDQVIATASPLDKAYGINYEQLAELVSGMTDGMTDSMTAFSYEESIAALQDALLPHVDDIKALFNEHTTITTTDTDDGLTVKLAVSGDGAVSFIEAIVDLIQNNEDVKNAFEAMFAMTGGVVTIDDLFAQADVESLISDMKESPVAIDITLTCNNARVIRRAVTTLREENKDDEGNVTYGEELLYATLNLSENGGFSLEIETEGEEISLDYDVTDTESRRKVSISIGMDSVTLTPLTYTYNKSNHTYSLELEIPSTLSAEITGTYEASESEATITVTDISATYYSSGDSIESLLPIPVSLPITASITVKASDTAPAAPTDYTSIADLSEEELTEITLSLMQDPVLGPLMELFATESEPTYTPDGTYVYENKVMIITEGSSIGQQYYNVHYIDGDGYFKGNFYLDEYNTMVISIQEISGNLAEGYAKADTMFSYDSDNDVIYCNYADEEWCFTKE